MGGEGEFWVKHTESSLCNSFKKVYWHSSTFLSLNIVCRLVKTVAENEMVKLV